MNNLNKSIICLGSGIFLISISLLIGSQFHENKIPPSSQAIIISGIMFILLIVALCLCFVGIIYLAPSTSLSNEKQNYTGVKQ